LPKEKVVVVGLGEVGHTLLELLKESNKFTVYGFDVNEKIMESLVGKMKLPETVDVMHICYPCVDQRAFIQTSLGYVRKFKPKLTIIDSTVSPLTTRKIYKSTKSPVVHSPIRGMHTTHESMKKDVKFWRKYIGGMTEEAVNAATEHFEKLGLKVKVLKGPEETELAKLFDTIYRAWMIACSQEMHRISRYYKADYSDIMEVISDGHRIYADRPPHYPAFIGGHCLIPNTELLLKSHNSDFLRLTLKSNRKRKREMRDKRVTAETEKAKQITGAVQNEMKRLLEQARSEK